MLSNPVVVFEDSEWLGLYSFYFHCLKLIFCFNNNSVLASLFIKTVCIEFIHNYPPLEFQFCLFSIFSQLDSSLSFPKRDGSMDHGTENKEEVSVFIAISKIIKYQK